MISIIPKSDTPSGFDLALESKSGGMSDLDAMNVMAHVCSERAHDTLSQKYHVLCDGSILTIIFVISISDTPSDFDLVL